MLAWTLSAALAGPLDGCEPARSVATASNWTCEAAQLSLFFHGGPPEETADALLRTSLAPLQSDVSRLRVADPEPFALEWRGGQAEGRRTSVSMRGYPTLSVLVAVLPWSESRHLLLTCIEPEGHGQCAPRMAAVGREGVPVPPLTDEEGRLIPFPPECRWESTAEHPIDIACGAAGRLTWTPVADADAARRQAVESYEAHRLATADPARFTRCRIAGDRGRCASAEAAAGGWVWTGYTDAGAALCLQPAAGAPSPLCAVLVTAR